MNTVQAIEEMMKVWDQIVSVVKSQFPNASEEQVYHMAKSAMNKSLGM